MACRVRQEADGVGVPIPRTLVDELLRFRSQLGAVSGRLFPRARNPTEPITPDMLNQDLVIAERSGRVPKLHGVFGTHTGGSGQASGCISR